MARTKVAIPKKVGMGKKAIDAHLFEAKCLELKRRGLSCEGISQQLGSTSEKVSGAVKRALARVDATLIDGDVTSERMIQVAQVDEMLHALYARAIGEEERVVETENGPMVIKEPSERAIETILKLQKRKAELLGLDLEKKQDVTASGPTKIEVVYNHMEVKGPDAPPSTPPSITIVREPICLPAPETQETEKQ